MPAPRGHANVYPYSHVSRCSVARPPPISPPPPPPAIDLSPLRRGDNNPMLKATISVAAVILLATVPTAFAIATPVAGPSCTASDTTARSCVFTCFEGATISVSGANGNEWYDQLFTASCGGQQATCSADPGETCEDTSGKTSSAGEGTCTMESDGEGAVTCASAGGEDPTSGCPTSDPVECICPPWLCGIDVTPITEDARDRADLIHACLLDVMVSLTQRTKFPPENFPEACLEE